MRLASLWLCSSAYVTRPSGTGRRFNVKAGSSPCKTEPPWAAYLPLSFQPSAIPLLWLKYWEIYPWKQYNNCSAGVDALLRNFGGPRKDWAPMVLFSTWIPEAPVPQCAPCTCGCPCPAVPFWTLQKLCRYVGRQGMIWSHWPKLDALFPSKNLLILQTLVLSYWTCREICL